jgi:uncharacterized protein YkwD
LAARPPSPKGWWRTTALALGVALALMVTPFQATAATTSTEGRLLEMINRTRASRGLASLTVRDDLIGMARRHSAKMARRRLMFHHGCLSCRFPSGSWRALAENVGYGPGLRGIHRMMMRSAAHRQNLLGGFDEIGVGVVRKGGRFWVTEIFFS